MKLQDLMEDETQLSYDKVYGKIKLDIVRGYYKIEYYYKDKLHRNDGKPAIE